MSELGGPRHFELTSLISPYLSRIILPVPRSMPVQPVVLGPSEPRPCQCSAGEIKSCRRELRPGSRGSSSSPAAIPRPRGERDPPTHRRAAVLRGSDATAEWPAPTVAGGRAGHSCECGPERRIRRLPPARQSRPRPR